MKRIKTETNEQGCHLVVSHRLNQDGYFRKRIKGKLVMYHRYIYEQEVGEIPEGYEVDHLCRNRNCIKPEHLQCLSNKEHTVKTNQERYADRKKAAKIYWESYKPTGTQLAEVFNVSFGIGCRWVRQWKEEN